MPDGHYLTPEDRDLLARNADLQRKTPVNTPRPAPDKEKVRERAPEVYVAVPPVNEGIPARSGDTPGYAECCLYRLVHTDDNTTHTLEPVLNRSQKHVRVLVYNIYTEEYPPARPPNEYYIKIARGKDGRWLCDPPDEELFTTTTSTTSTTTTPEVRPVQSSCEGYGRWIWNAAELIWELDENTCGPASTTSSTTTTSTSSTTTTCMCPLPEDEDGETTTTSTTSTTTTAGCEPMYPEFCGEDDGDCTYTFCSHVVNDEDEPDCGQSTTTSTTTTTTTTTSTSTTTTTPDPNTSTTTTTPYDCNTTTTAFCHNLEGSCKYKCVGSQWIPISLDCEVSDDPNYNCGCEPPPPGECEFCSDYESPCTVPEGTTTTAWGEFPCSFYCWYLWLGPIAGWAWWWHGPDINSASACSPEDLARRNGDHCFCTPPSFEGSEICEVGLGQFVTSPCRQFDPVSTTTTTTTTPVHPCYTTTSTTSTSSTSTTTTTSTSTTTTTGCATEHAMWKAKEDLSGWDLVETTCPEECPPLEPPYEPFDTCHKVQTPCGAGTTSTSSTTTTTSSSTTTTTTTTSTTTTPAECGHVYTEGWESGGLGDWTQETGAVGVDSVVFHSGAKSMRLSGNSISTARLEFTNCSFSLVSFWYYKDAAVTGATFIHPTGSVGLNVDDTWTQVSGVFLQWNFGVAEIMDFVTMDSGEDCFLYIDDIEITNLDIP